MNNIPRIEQVRHSQEYLIKKVNKLLDKIESKLKFIVESIKAKKGITNG
jgi:tetrahydromethanopterin S-methyltransferase subunit G